MKRSFPELALLELAGSPHGDGDAMPGCGSDTSKKPPTTAPPTKAAMDITYRDLPDDKWKRAAEIVVAATRDILTQSRSTRAVVQPYSSPDGARVPYLLFIESTTADGTPAFRGTAAVWGDKLANGGKAAAATGFLAAAGFPASHVSLGHLLELLYLTGAIDVTWLVFPSSVGWEGIQRPFLGTDLVRTLDYAKTGAVLHLYRGVGAGGGPGGGFTPPEVERLDVTFDAKAQFTTTVLRRDPATGTWRPVP